MFKLNYFHRSPDNTWDGAATYETIDDAIKAVTGMGQHNIRSIEDEKTYLANATKTAASESAKEERKMLLGGLDKRVFEATGIERNPSEKTSDYIVNGFKSMIDKAKADDVANKKFRDEKLSESQAASEYKAIHEKSQSQFNKSKDEYESRIKSLEDDKFSFKVDLSVKDAMSRIKPTLKKIDLIDDASQIRLNNFYQKFKVVQHEGTFILHDRKDDTPIIDSANGNPLSIFDVLSKEFENLVDTGRQQGGTGGKPGTGGDGNVNTESLKINLPADINTRVKLSDYINSGKLNIDGNVIEPNSPIATKIFMINQYKEDGTMLPVS